MPPGGIPRYKYFYGTNLKFQAPESNVAFAPFILGTQYLENEVCLGFGTFKLEITLNMLLADQTIDASKIIPLMLSPAVMISACGLLLLGANNKYSSVLNRIRLINDEKRRLIIKASDRNFTPEESLRLESTARQLTDLSVRARLVRNSVLSYTIAAAFFVMSSLLIGLALFQGFVEIHYVSTASFMIGMLLVFIGVVFGVLESRKGYEIVQLEINAEQ